MICRECETVAHCTSHGCIPKTTKKDEAMKLALEALTNNAPGFRPDIDTAITALREALSEQPAQQEQRKQEPVYFVWLRAHCAWMHTDEESFEKISDDERWMLYTAPPAQRTWVGLSDAQSTVIWANSQSVDEAIRATEKQLMENNK